VSALVRIRQRRKEYPRASGQRVVYSFVRGTGLQGDVDRLVSVKPQTVKHHRAGASFASYAGQFGHLALLASGYIIAATRSVFGALNGHDWVPRSPKDYVLIPQPNPSRRSTIDVQTTIRFFCGVGQTPPNNPVLFKNQFFFPLFPHHRFPPPPPRVVAATRAVYVNKAVRPGEAGIRGGAHPCFFFSLYSCPFAVDCDGAGNLPDTDGGMVDGM